MDQHSTEASGRVWPIIVWVCPSCGNYYGASSAEGLNEQVNHNAKNEPTFNRTRCPSCKDTRVQCMFNVELIPQEPTIERDT